MSLAPTIGLLDYGSGNLHSVRRALTACGAQVLQSSHPERLLACQGLVVPGVGAYEACMQGLAAVDGVALIKDWVQAEKPLLGICVGHQVLFARGVEHGCDTPGVGIFPGTVEALRSARVPHMGWNQLAVPPTSRVLAGLDGQWCYFVHSYAVHQDANGGQPAVPAAGLITWTTHETDRFVAAVEWGSVTSTQFHPEKSGAVGAKLLRNWLQVVASGPTTQLHGLGSEL